jgi:hypothetical protein
MDPSASDPHGLRLQPGMIPRLRLAYQQALDLLAPALADARDGFRIDRPAMGDAASGEFQAAFNAHVGPAGAQLVAFEERLREASATLAAIQHAYDRNETDTAAALSRRLEP